MIAQDPSYPEARGGCQCGAIRFTVSAGPAEPGLCHCRMCQRATGNAFAPLYKVPRARVSWQGTPREWASSSLAWRGFCPTCGTPLYYRDAEGYELMAGCLSPDFPFVPLENEGVQARVPWLAGIGALPDRPTDPALARAVVSHQAPEEF